MPRIDPLQLLKCLSVLLTPEGGILSREEVPRLVNLMTKFSKKLVSKCVYVLILKSTDTELVDMFMAEGGWTLIQVWLQDAVQTSNWDLVREILELLLITPVDVERLKLNILPKLIKSLSRREELEGVGKLSTQLVQQWLAIVRGSGTAAVQQQVSAVQQPQVKPAVADSEPALPGNRTEITGETADDKENVAKAPAAENDNSSAISAGTFYKPTVRDGKLVIRKLPAADDATDGGVAGVKEEPVTEDAEKAKEEENKSDDKEKSKSGSRSSKSSSKSSSRDKDRDKDRKKSNSSSSKSSSSSRSKSSSSSSRDKDRRDRDKHRSSSSSKSDGRSSSKSSSKDRRDSKEKLPEKDKEKQAEKDKDTLAKIKPQSLDKLGRIPKKSGGSSPEDKPKEVKDAKDAKKKSFSIGVVRKDSEERPKTVKIFNSKMRSTGLEEEVKPAPPRPVKKPTPSVQLPTIPTKRPSPPREHRDPILPPEKKIKIDKVDVPERPGAIKLIPPKPKPMLQESDLFMDALTASATTKKEPKKRKRRLSVSKDVPTSPSSSPAGEQPQTPTSPSQSTPSSSPALGLKNIAPINFYQDTLKTEENAENSDSPDNENKENASENKVDVKEELPGEENKDTPTSPMTPTDDTNGEEPIEAKKPKLEGGLKGVLLYTKKKGPKRSISWKNDNELVELRYFELDETERVNVTKTFGDMAKMEMTSEREALQMSRKVVGEDTMEAQIPWRVPYVIDQADPLAVPGHKSLEKDIQFAREKSVLQALYFDKRRIPDSPEEPIPENHQMSDPIHIPLEDPDSQEIDLRSTPWPEPKGSPPHVEPPIPPHNIFPTVPGPFNNPFNSMNNLPPPQFQAMPPRFPGPGVPGGNPGPMVPANFIPPNMIPNGNMMVPPNMFPPGPMHDGYGPGPGPGPGPDCPPIYNQNNMPNTNNNMNMNMFPPNNFNHRQGNRGGYRRGGGNGGNWVRMGGPGNWKRGGGGGHRGGRLCKHVQNHGYCRNRDNCPFVHP